MNEKYTRNIPSISEKEQTLLGRKKVIIIGCGGLGGHIIEHLVRIGVGHVTGVDGDTFQASNLNRQLFSSEDVLGKSKVSVAESRALAINSSVHFYGKNAFLDETNAQELISGHDLVIDALDNISSRLILEDACAAAGIPLIHGAICGWQAQISTVLPGSNILHELYAGCPEAADKSTLSFTPALCAAVQVAEAVKLLCGHPGDLENKLAVIDLRHMDWNIISLR